MQQRTVVIIFRLILQAILRTIIVAQMLSYWTNNNNNNNNNMWIYKAHNVSSPSLSSLPLRCSPHIAAKWSGGALKLPSGSGRSPAAKRFLVHFQLFNGPLVTILCLEKQRKTGFYGFVATRPAEKKFAGKPGVPLCHPSPTVTRGSPPPCPLSYTTDLLAKFLDFLSCICFYVYCVPCLYNIVIFYNCELVNK